MAKPRLQIWKIIVRSSLDKAAFEHKNTSQLQFD